MAKENIIQLPEAQTKGKVSLEEAILTRRSVRSFAQRDLSLQQISQLLWSAQGITSERGLRAAPSAGALYPMEIYLLNKDGLYHYLPQGHRLEQLGEVDLRKSLSDSALGQSSILQAAVDIVISVVYSRVTFKYGERGINDVYIEAGHIAQNIHLEAVAMGLGSVPVRAFEDAEVKKLLSLPKDQEAIYIIPVGYAE